MNTQFIEYHKEKEIRLDEQIRFHPQLTWGEKVFYAEVQAISSKGKCYYSPKKLGEMLHVSPLTIATWVKNLTNNGFLEIVTDVNDTIFKQILKPIQK